MEGKNINEKALKRVKQRKLSHLIYAISIMVAGLAKLISGLINWVKQSEAIISVPTVDIVLICLGSSFLLIGTIWLITQLRRRKEEKIKEIYLNCL